MECNDGADVAGKVSTIGDPLTVTVSGLGCKLDVKAKVVEVSSLRIGRSENEMTDVRTAIPRSDKSNSTELGG